jgi:nucleoid-associated protein YgaU
MNRFNNIFSVITVTGLLLVGLYGLGINDTATSATDKLTSFLLLQPAETETNETTPQISATSTTAPDTVVAADQDAVVVDDSAGASDQKPKTATAVAETYTVVEGDTYGCIAERIYGSYEYWPQLAAANNYKSAVGFTEYHLFVGASLSIPKFSGTTFAATGICSNGK